MRTLDVFGVLGRSRLADPPEALFMCPIPGSNGLFIVHRADGTLVATNALTEAEARNIGSNMQAKDWNDPGCAMPQGQPAVYNCPIGNGQRQMTDLLTGRRITDPVAGAGPDNVLCPGYADRQAQPPPVPPPPALRPPPPQNPGGVVVFMPYPQPYPMPMPVPVAQPVAAPAPAPTPAPSSEKAPAAAAAASSGISPLAIAGGAGALGLATLFATGVIKL